MEFGYGFGVRKYMPNVTILPHMMYVTNHVVGIIIAYSNYNLYLNVHQNLGWGYLNRFLQYRC